MRCESCGLTAPVLKAVRWRTGGEREFVLCDSCWLPVRGSVWVLCGPVPAHGFCPGCSNWFSVRELSELQPAGWKWDAPSGLCHNCAKEGA